MEKLSTSKWNHSAELLDDNNDPIRYSNILDLLTYATGFKTGLSEPPIGYNVFSKLLEEINVPRHLLGARGKQYTNKPTTWQTL